MSGIDIFQDDWRDCLRAHYAYVIRERDANNEQSLITVLMQTGFTESEILSMRQEIVLELGWVEPAPPQVAAPAEALEAEPVPELLSQPDAPIDVQGEHIALLEAIPQAISQVEVAPDYPPIPEDVAVFLDAAPEVEAAPEQAMTLLEEDIADAELSVDEEAMLTLSEAASEPQIVALALPLDAAAPLDNQMTAPEFAPDDAHRTAAPLPERKSDKKKPKKTQQMSLF